MSFQHLIPEKGATAFLFAHQPLDPGPLHLIEPTLGPNPEDSSRTWVRGLSVGAAVGGVGRGLIGLGVENLVNDGNVNVGTATAVGVGVGIVAGALIGAGIDWLIGS